MIPRRYLLLCSPEPGKALAKAADAAGPCGLLVAYHSPRTAILAEYPETCIPLETGEGAFVGTVFRRGADSGALASIGRGLSHAIMASDGQAALTALWGAYVLASENAHSGRISVRRDPSGGMPCYIASKGALAAFASDLATLVAAGMLAPSVDYPALLRHLAYPDLCLTETCIAGVSELLPGEACEIAAEGNRTTCWWSPWDVAGAPLDADPQGAADQLRETIDGCVAAWSGCCGSIVTSLSGGLDSSIVASALARAGGAVSAINMVGPGADGDERAYAQLVCQHLGMACAEAPFDQMRVDLRKSSAPDRPRPVGTAHMQPLEAALRHRAAVTAADGLVNGMAGDSVFCSVRSALPVVDSIAARRAPAEIWRTVRDVATLADVSSFAVLRQAMRMRLRGRRPLRAAGATPYLSRKAQEEMAALALPPWLRPPPGVPPGKAYHVEMIARVQCFVEGLERWTAPSTIVPLLSQPVLELCLRIPTWQWVTGGRNRAAARDAYAGRLPGAIVDRRSKGGPDAMSLALCLDNLPLLREIILEGALAQRALLDRPTLDQALTRQALLQRGHHHELLSLVEAEAWIRHWTAQPAG